MGTLSTWLVAVVGGALATLFAGYLSYLLKKQSSILKLYKKALSKVCENARLSPGEERILFNALKNPAVVETIRTRVSDPGEEAQRLLQAIAALAHATDRLADPTFAAKQVGQLLDTQFKIEGEEKYSNYHARNRDREPYFAVPDVPAGLAVRTSSEQVILSWDALPLNKGVSHIWRYHLARSTSETGPFTEVGAVLAETRSLSFTDDKGLVNGTTYYYTVTAESKALKLGSASVLISAVPSVPAPPESQPPSIPASPASSTSVLPSTFFVTNEYLQGKADNCIGREQELTRLHADFADASHRLVLIEGFAGLGKTTLTARLATEISQHYNALCVNCKGIPVTVEHFLYEMGRFAFERCKNPVLKTIVETPQCSQEEKDNGFLDFLTWVSRSPGKVANDNSLQPVALFFDDYHLVKDPALTQLVLKTAECHIDVKVVLVIESLPPELQVKADMASALQLKGLSLADCRKLIEKRARDYPALGELDDEMLRLIWKRTGYGVPIALNILITMTSKRTLDDVLEKLPNENYDPLMAETNKQWFKSLFDELSPDECQVATELSIFRRPTSRRALLNVSRCANADEIIDKLLDRFIVVFDGKQYAMDALWSDYTRRFLSSDVKELHSRAAEFYHAFQSKDRHAEVMSRLECCYHFMQAGEMEQAEKELISIAGTLRSWGFFQEFADMLAEIEKSVKKNNKQLDPQLVLEQSAMLYARGDVKQAIAVLMNLASMASGETEIKALQELGWIHIETGNRDKAEEFLERSKRLAQQENLPKLQAEALSRLQHSAYHKCEYDKALVYNHERLNILEQLKDDLDVREAIAWTNHEIGNVYRERGFYEEALKYYQQDLLFWRTLRNPPSRLGWITYDIGQIYRNQKKLQEAQKQFEEALQFFESMQHLFGIAHVKIELGRVGVQLGPAEAALKEVEDAVDLLRQVKGVAGEAYALGALGQIYLYLGKFELALKYFQESLDIETGLGSTKGIAWLKHQISLVYEQQGKRLRLAGDTAAACSRFHEAYENITRAQALFAQIGAVADIYGIQLDADRIKLACDECADPQ